MRQSVASLTGIPGVSAWRAEVLPHAAVLGAALRFACTLSGRTGDLLALFRLSVVDGVALLDVDPSGRNLIAEAPVKRFEQFASAAGLTPKVAYCD